ncbi:hypothetical protein [Streptomyces sp. enrichment culture]|uniref:hypothetical protein n=1 Tax=Streptomyces sp. enrichment culture TaxID=1795815 RepID=UPI003F5710DA
MSGRADSDTPPDTHAEDPEETGKTGETDDAAGADGGAEADDAAGDARRARWAAAGAGAVLALAGVAAALLRLTGPAPVLVPVAYACGAAVCALAALLGSRGRTRRALWLLVAGLMVMALGDQFD